MQTGSLTPKVIKDRKPVGIFDYSCLYWSIKLSAVNYPDFRYIESNGPRVVGDFKYTTNPVNQTIPKYEDFCDRLEFWIKRSTPYENSNPKIVIRYYDDYILPLAEKSLTSKEYKMFLKDMEEVEAELPSVEAKESEITLDRYLP